MLQFSMFILESLILNVHSQDFNSECSLHSNILILNVHVLDISIFIIIYSRAHELSNGMPVSFCLSRRGHEDL